MWQTLFTCSLFCRPDYHKFRLGASKHSMATWTSWNHWGEGLHHPVCFMTSHFKLLNIHCWLLVVQNRIWDSLSFSIGLISPKSFFNNHQVFLWFLKKQKKMTWDFIRVAIWKNNLNLHYTINITVHGRNYANKLNILNKLIYREIKWT